MKIFETYQDLPPELHGSVLVIGNFDGVHLGHQALLERAHTIASEKEVPVCVLTFDPHPREVFRPDDPPFRITPKALKAARLEYCGVDYMVCLSFDWDFASQSADDFVRDVLQAGLKPAHVVVGYDFRFGQLRVGEASTIRDAGIEVDVVNEVEGKSSTNVRQALRHGKIRQANDLLGWEWEIWGEVVKGDQRGRELGYPTANFSLDKIVHPAYGVYAGMVQVEDGGVWHKAAINIGIRPMFEIPRAQVESYIFDFDQDIYGRMIRVKPLHFLRGEAKFDTIDDLIVQMKQDCEKTQSLLDD